MSKTRTPSQELCAGRRRIEELDFCKLIKDFEWNASVKKWVLQCRITISIPEDDRFVPKVTQWFLLIDDLYPWGSIDFFPDKENGLTVTFQHQNYNETNANDTPWRSGKICCNTPMRSFKKHVYDQEPNRAHERLKWNLQRARDWLEAASKDQLVRNGDPFELPYYPSKNDHSVSVVVFSEDADSLRNWDQIDEKCGVAILEEYESVPKRIFVKSFYSSKEKELYRPSFGHAVSLKGKNSTKGIWIKIHNIAILEPWQAPASWEELKNVFGREDIDLKNLLGPILKDFRDGKNHFLLVGFPIPKVFGGRPEQMHWQALKMPVLSHGQIDGFGETEKSYRLCDFERVLHNQKPLEWYCSENWHAKQISARGRYPESLLKLSVALIGAGAIGSMFAELLVRSGVRSLAIIDDDILAIGNLVRHTLDSTKIGCSKAEALAERLNLINPNACVKAYNTSFSLGNEDLSEVLEHCHLIIDCTAEEFVIDQMSKYPWDSEKTFLSISTGMYAKKLFIYLSKGCQFDDTDFNQAINVWLEKEKEEFREEDFPWEGIGCWHPVFPARVDDLWLMASAASKILVDTIEAGIKENQLMVFEQKYDNEQFIGVQRVK